MSRGVVIVDGVRTPFCKFGTALAALPADELGRQVVAALLARTGVDPGTLDEVIFGNVAQPAEAANVARVIALRAGVPQRVPALTVQRNCASGLEALLQAAQRIRAGVGEAYLVGGVESMSQIPLLFSHAAAAKFAGLARARTPWAKARALAELRPKDFLPQAAMRLGLTDPVSGLNMGQTAELLAREGGITREAQDVFALRSHQRATAAREKLAAEIAPVFLPDGSLICEDNGPRANQSAEALAALRPVFEKRYGGVTAGNASQISDGAVALLVMSERRAEALGLPTLGRLVESAVVGCDPARMGLGPVPAIRALAERGYRYEAAEVVEINEAFAAQVLAVQAALPGLEEARLNVNGGAIALGHPVGASGARLVLTALKELQRRGGGQALVSLCVGGGQGAAAWLERGQP